jgi:hypothetical protein
VGCILQRPCADLHECTACLSFQDTPKGMWLRVKMCVLEQGLPTDKPVVHVGLVYSVFCSLLQLMYSLSPTPPLHP